MLVTSRAAIAGSFVIAWCVLNPSDASGQILKRLKNVVKDAAESETMSRIDRLVRGKVRCVFDDLECIRKADASGSGAVLTDDQGGILLDDKGRPVSDPNAGAEIAMKAEVVEQPGQGAWANYDFQPGDSILFVDDYSTDVVGDFPRRFELIEGSFEIVEWQGSRYVRAHSGGLVAIPLPRTLPERFTVETSVNLRHGNAYVRLLPDRAYFGRGRSYGGSAVTIEEARSKPGYLSS